MKRGSDHTRAQREGRNRDENVCQMCGSTIKPEGHHMFDYIFGGAANSDNIITLCHNCHKKVHAGSIDLITF